MWAVVKWATCLKQHTVPCSNQRIERVEGIENHAISQQAPILTYCLTLKIRVDRYPNQNWYYYICQRLSRENECHRRICISNTHKLKKQFCSRWRKSEKSQICFFGRHNRVDRSFLSSSLAQIPSLNSRSSCVIFPHLWNIYIFCRRISAAAVKQIFQSTDSMRCCRAEM
jgi:hypothetical protein